MSDDPLTSEDEAGLLWCPTLDTSVTPPPYTIEELLQQNFVNSTSNPLVVIPTSATINVEFGNFSPGEIHGMKWDDQNGDGVKDAGEPGVNGTEIQLFRIDPPNNFGVLVNSTFTDADGNYWFMDLPPGTYRVKEIVPADRVQTFPPFGLPHIVRVNSTQVIEGVDFGNHELTPAEIHGMKFLDQDGDGIKDPEEPVISGTLICLFDGLFFIPIDCTNTDAQGIYWFMNLPPGTYVVSEIIPPGLTNTTPPDQIVDLDAGENATDINFGNRLPAAPPQEVTVIGDTGSTFNGLPVIFWGSETTYTKNVFDAGHCAGVMPIQVKLVIEMPETGGMFEQMMTKLSDGVTWSATFPPFFPHHGTAFLTFYVDCPPDTPGFPEDTALMSGEDEIQVGGNIFIDPSGTIVDSCIGQPLAGATVTLLKESPPQSENFVIPDTSDHIPADNPQITGTDGAYGWVVVPGLWKVSAELSGFNSNQSLPLSIPPAVTDLVISLEPTDGCPIKGDPNNDGSINIIDMIRAGNQIVGNVQLDPILFAAADISPPKNGAETCGNGAVNISDMIAIGNAIVSPEGPVAFVSARC